MSVPQAQIIKAVSSPKGLLITGGVILVGGLIGYFGIVRPILKKTGIIEDKKAIKNLAQIKDYKGFNPNYHSPSKVTLTPERAKILADSVYNAGGVFNDNEDVFYSVLTEAGNANNLSYLSKIFSIRKNASLGDHYGYYMNDKDQVDRIKDILMTY